MADIARSIARGVYHARFVQRGLRAMFAARDRKITRTYLRSHPVTKLHIGAGLNMRPDWLNTNWYPIRFVQRHCIFMDTTEPFPLPDASFDYVFTEHVIEHIPYLSGELMLRECFRVLKPGGTLRISTPDIAFLADLLQPDLTPLQLRYIDEARSVLPDDVPATPATVVNNFVRDWGHQFIYDRATLTTGLAAAGFTDIVPRPVNLSDDPELSGIENAARMTEGFLELESMVFEARRPASRAVA